MGIFDNQTPQFGGNSSAFQLNTPVDYNSLIDYSFGSGPYASAANSMRLPSNSFGGPGVGVVGERSFMDGMLGGKNLDGTSFNGWGGTALGIAQGLFSGYMGMKNYGLAKDSLAQGKKQFQMNYDAQKTITNTAMEDRQRARVANNPNSVAVNDYMNKNRIA